MKNRHKLEERKNSDGSITVSWDDRRKMRMYKGRIYAIVYTFFFSALAVGIYFNVVVSGGGILALLYIIVAAPVMWMSFYIFWRHRNVVRFTETQMDADGQSYPIGDITRFEYAMRSEVTGGPVAHPSDSLKMIDPVVIRAWVNDRRAITIAENTWPLETNHEIRATLEDALHAMRKQRNAAKRGGSSSHGRSTNRPKY